MTRQIKLKCPIEKLKKEKHLRKNSFSKKY